MIAALVRGNYVFRLLKNAVCGVAVAMPLTLWFLTRRRWCRRWQTRWRCRFAGLVILPLTLADIVVPGDFLWRIAGQRLSLLMSFWSFVPSCRLRPDRRPRRGMCLLRRRGRRLAFDADRDSVAMGGSVADCAMLLWRPPLLPVGDFRLTALDVGQGSATVIETSRRTMIYDTGPRHAFSALRDFLRGQGRQHLDIVMVSHATPTTAARRGV